jgi:hypothetical protein
MIDNNQYFYRAKTPSTTEGVFALQRWKKDLLLDLPNQHVALKLESMHNFIQLHFYNRNIIKNIKRLLNFIYDLFFELYGRNNFVDEIDLVKNFDRFISKHKHIFYAFNEEMIILYLNIFIESY